MIMSMTFNPCEMDYPSWLTISGFVMTILIFFMTHIIFSNCLFTTSKFIQQYSHNQIL